MVAVVEGNSKIGLRQPVEQVTSGVVISLERGVTDLRMVQLMPMPPCCILPNWFNLSGAGLYPGCHGKDDVKRVLLLLQKSVLDMV